MTDGAVVHFLKFFFTYHRNIVFLASCGQEISKITNLKL